MDVKAKINEIINKIKDDPNLLKGFAADPVKTIEQVAGVDLPDEEVNKVLAEAKKMFENGELQALLGKLEVKDMLGKAQSVLGKDATKVMGSLGDLLEKK